jgi:hypothetical protein
MLSDDRRRVYEGLKNHRGSIAEVVHRTSKLKEGGYTRDYVYMVLSGKRSNIEILNVAVDVLADRNEEKKRQLRRLATKVGQLQAAH